MFCPTWFLGGLQPLHRELFEFLSMYVEIGRHMQGSTSCKQEFVDGGGHIWLRDGTTVRGCSISCEFIRDSSKMSCNLPEVLKLETF